MGEKTKKSFCEIIDVRFPDVDPAWSEWELEDFVELWFQSLLKRGKELGWPERAIVFHIAGEMGFSYRLIGRLKRCGFKVINATTQRVVTEEEGGKKISLFRFVRWREY